MKIKVKILTAVIVVIMCIFIISVNWNNADADNDTEQISMKDLFGIWIVKDIVKYVDVFDTMEIEYYESELKNKTIIISSDKYANMNGTAFEKPVYHLRPYAISHREGVIYPKTFSIYWGREPDGDEIILLYAVNNSENKQKEMNIYEIVSPTMMISGLDLNMGIYVEIEKIKRSDNMNDMAFKNGEIERTKIDKIDAEQSRELIQKLFGVWEIYNVRYADSEYKYEGILKGIEGETVNIKQDDYQEKNINIQYPMYSILSESFSKNNFNIPKGSSADWGYMDEREYIMYINIYDIKEDYNCIYEIINDSEMVQVLDGDHGILALLRKIQ